MGWKRPTRISEDQLKSQSQQGVSPAKYYSSSPFSSVHSCSQSPVPMKMAGGSGGSGLQLCWGGGVCAAAPAALPVSLCREEHLLFLCVSKHTHC